MSPNCCVYAHHAMDWHSVRDASQHTINILILHIMHSINLYVMGTVFMKQTYIR